MPYARRNMLLRKAIHTGFAGFPAKGAKNSAFLTGNLVPVPCSSLD